MKMRKKSLLLILSMLCVVGSCFVAYGLYWVSSDPLHVDLQYSVVLSNPSVTGSKITLNAAVTYNGSPVGAGLNVDFYYSLNGAAWANFDSKTTDAGGVAQSVFDSTTNGSYDFMATVTIP
jgi:hypothetical protein